MLDSPWCVSPVRWRRPALHSCRAHARLRPLEHCLARGVAWPPGPVHDRFMEPSREIPPELPLTPGSPPRPAGRGARRPALRVPRRSPLSSRRRTRGIRMQSDHPYSVAIAELCRSTLAVLTAFEHVQRHLHPSEHPHLRGLLERPGADLARALTVFPALPPPQSLAAFHAQMERAGAAANEAVRLFSDPA